MFPSDDIPVGKQTGLNAVYTKKATEKVLWHQRLGHPCDEYLFNTHKCIKGVPKLSTISSVLNICPTCVWAKQTLAQQQEQGKGAHPITSTVTTHSIKKAQRPYQGLSIDFSFAVVSSSNSKCQQDYEGINGETSWILIVDHYTGMIYGDTRTSKAAPVLWLKHFLAQYNPPCKDKCVFMDQGGELFNNPEI